MVQRTIKDLHSTLTSNLDLFIREVKTKQSGLMATDKWTVKDVLCHVVYWHESYAANYNALAKGTKPSLLEGPGYILNEQSVSSLRKCSINKLQERLNTAQKLLSNCILEKSVPKMTYKKGGRIYKTADFLDLVARHICTHTKHIKRAK